MTHFLHSIGWAIATFIVVVPWTSRQAYKDCQELLRYCGKNRRKRRIKEFESWALRTIIFCWTLSTLLPVLAVFLLSF